LFIIVRGRRSGVTNYNLNGKDLSGLEALIRLTAPTSRNLR
jgi:hypothetical protein